VSGQPFVSIVTPYYNTAPYIAECIESVLAQAHSNFEYLLVNNCSTDGSQEIAARYAARDRRIQLFDNAAFLDQTRNFNGALERISPDSKYVKLALADDVIFPECVSRMVELAEREPGVAIVSSYRMWGDQLDRAGVPLKASRLPGREACRRMLLEGLPLTGSQNTVLYRADVVRARRPFYAPDRHFADCDAAIEILLEHDLGFVHQVLSFTRTENDSIWSQSQAWDPLLLNKLLALEQFGDRVLSTEESLRARAEARREYFQALGRHALRSPGRAFWEYHRRGLALLRWTLDWRDVAPWTLRELLRIVLNPENTLRRLGRRIRRHPAAAIPAPRRS
jgi:glycosyltransferase involved in cell wall biosynthesis